MDELFYKKRISDLYSATNIELLNAFYKEINFELIEREKQKQLLLSKIETNNALGIRTSLQDKKKLKQILDDEQEEITSGDNTLPDFVVAVFLSLQMPITNVFICEFLSLYKIAKKNNKK